MTYDTRADQADRIVHALAELPGSMLINITSKKFPRFGPASFGSTYEEKTRLIRVDSVPAKLEVPADAEEVSITLQGSLNEPANQADLVAKLHTLFHDSGIGAQWNVRAEIQEPREQQRPYQLKVFM